MSLQVMGQLVSLTVEFPVGESLIDKSDSDRFWLLSHPDRKQLRQAVAG